MSRIGNQLITIAPQVTVTQEGNQVVVKGPKGQVSVALPTGISISQEGDQLTVKRKSDGKIQKSAHGLVRSLISGAIIGVTQGYKKTLKLVGTGYRVQAKGNGVSLALGFSHTVEFDPTAGVVLKVEGNDTIHVDGFDKQAVGQVAANLRMLRPPEVYKGKGIRYADEVVKTKPGKAVTATTK